MTDDEKLAALRRAGAVALTLCVMIGFTLGMLVACIIFTVT